jgi:ribosomal-protein-alanine N-acetyltransferase
LSAGAIEFPEGGIDDGEIRLRLKRDGDLDAVVAACQDPEIPRWTRVPEPYGEAEARAWFEEQDGKRERGEGLELLIADAGDDRVLGSIGLTDVEWDERRADIGYWVAREPRGRGVATRAVRLLARWAFEALPLERLGIVAAVGNTASEGVAERAGFRREGVLRSFVVIKGQRRDMVSFSLLPGELDDEPVGPSAVR